MTPVGFDTQVELLRNLASAFPEPKPELTLSWERGGARVGIYTHSSGARVFLNGAELDVNTLDQAKDLLGRIFADAVVAVTALHQGSVAYARLAPASDPAASLPTPGVWAGITAQRSVPDVDDMMIETWSGGVQEKE